MYASSTRSRRGFALGWVGIALILLSLMAFAMYFVTSSTQANLVHALVGEQYFDLCVSALSEALAEVNESVHTGQPLAGQNITAMLGKDFPSKPKELHLEFEPAHTREAAGKVYPGVTIDTVVLRSVGRYPPGEADPLLGVLELKGAAHGTLGGLRAGREVTYRLIFSVPCSTQWLAAPDMTYMRIHWGIPTLNPSPVSLVVKRI